MPPARTANRKRPQLLVTPVAASTRSAENDRARRDRISALSDARLQAKRPTLPASPLYPGVLPAGRRAAVGIRRTTCSELAARIRSVVSVEAARSLVIFSRHHADPRDLHDRDPRCRYHYLGRSACDLVQLSRAASVLPDPGHRARRWPS